MKKVFLPILFLLCLFSPAHATHNRAGEITLRQIDELTYEITITTFTYTLSQADRNRLEVQWGDNTYSYANRVSITKLPNFYQKNIYITQHTYPGPGLYEIVVQDPNRNAGVKNIPNSVNVVFSIKTTILINPTLGHNSTPVLLNYPIDRAALHQVFIHNPAAYDPDGDSISYKLTVCTEQDGRPIEGYTLPPASDTLFVDPVTGDLTWITPSDSGIYNIAMDVEEWRDGVKIGSIARDMQIEVYNTTNHQPEQNEPGNYCVAAGTRIAFDIIATDPDNDSILQSATGGPFVVEESPATYTVDLASAKPGYSRSRFEWQTTASHVREQYYTGVFKAEDDNDEITLVDLRNVNIKVIGPAPEMPRLIPGSNAVTVIWSPDTCLPVRGYRIYRRIGPAGYVPDTCTTGIPPETGYQWIGQTGNRLDTILVDNNSGKGLVQGNEYCYVVVSVYPDGSLSYPSPENCTPLIEGTPSILEVSVTEHSASGSIMIAWARPEEPDTIPEAGPYEYLIYRSDDLLGQSPVQVGSLSTPDLSDTVWTDENVNTTLFPWSYTVELYNDAPGNRMLLGQPETASSLYPDLIGGDNQIEIRMKKNVPWINYDYTIYRLNPDTQEYDSIGFTTDEVYVDEGLANGVEYCYRVTSTGWRVLGGKLYENVNYSHTNCTVPVDTIPPCPPDLRGFSECDSGYNHLSWSYEDFNIPCALDVVGYRLYYSPTLDATPVIIAEFGEKYDTVYKHYPDLSLTACYFVTAIDSFENESRPSTLLCLDECTNYVLPNVFSPNGDGVNDIYKPSRTSYVERVDMKIFNRWGLLVFETDDPDINWDGKITKTGKLVAPGVYYYICDVYEYRLTGVEVYYLTGFIYVYSGDSNDVFIE
jgi:gliding motility-associated-like protein